MILSSKYEIFRNTEFIYYRKKSTNANKYNYYKKKVSKEGFKLFNTKKIKCDEVISELLNKRL